MLKQIVMTKEGLDKLENELEELKSVKRKEVAEKIKIDLSFGDLSENSEVEVRVTSPSTGSSNVLNYKVVGSNEADPLSGSISDESAVGKALLNHGIGDKVEVEVPAGVMEYEILAISK